MRWTMLDLKINTLLVLSEEKNFTKASNRLAITQPAVSHQIKLLEEEFGCAIFIRGKNEVKLTEKGHLIVSYAKRMQALENKLQYTLANNDANPTNIKIGITHTSENNNIAAALGKYSALNTNTTITIITDVTKKLYTKLENYELDLIIVEEKLNRSDLRFLMLDTDYLICILSKDNPLATKSSITINDLKKQKMIMRLPTSATRTLFNASLTSINESINNFNIILEVDNISTIKSLVKKDIGVSILPKSSCQQDIKDGELIALPIENLSMVRETSIVYTTDFPYHDCVNEILKIYKELT